MGETKIYKREERVRADCDREAQERAGSCVNVAILISLKLRKKTHEFFYKKIRKKNRNLTLATVRRTRGRV